MTAKPFAPLKIISPIHRTLRQIGVHLDGRSLALGLRGQDAHLLAYLAYYGPCTAGQLGRVFGHKPSTLTSMLDRLEGDGLLSRKPNPRDRRSFQIATTDAGTNLGRQSRRIAEDFETDILARVTPEDLAGFDRVVAAVSAAIDEITDGVTPRKG